MLFFVLFISYLLGSFPTGYLISKLKGVDIRTVGSGNIGATNVLRNLGKKAGVIVFIIDFLKGLLPVILISEFSFGLVLPKDLLKVLVGGSAITGHLFPVFLGFKGGKAVATNLGVFCGISPLLTLISSFILLLIVKLTHYVAVGSIISMFCLTVLLFIKIGIGYFSIFAALMTIIIIIRHTENIKRLFYGKENKI